MLAWRLPLRAKAFYATIAVGMMLGVALNFSPIDPIKALYWSAVINGVTVAPIIVLMMMMASSRRVMGDFTVSLPLKLLGWLCAIVMGLCVAGLAATIVM